MKVLFLVPYPVGFAPSQRFRFEQFFKFLDEKKIEYNVQSFLDKKAWSILYKKGYRWQKFWSIVKGFIRRDWQMWNIWSYDYIFIHREVAPLGPPVYEQWIKLWKKKIIYDFDDAIWLPNTSEENKIIANLKWHSKVSDICSWAWKISSGNEFLANYARRHVMDQNQVVILPTTIDTDYHIPIESTSKNSSMPVVIGWTGSHSTAPYLDQVHGVIEKLASRYNIKFLIISNRPPERQWAMGSWQEWRRESEIEDLDQIDIGIMPMPDNEWTKGKCGFKALQFMALGKPVVASPVGVNNEIIQDGKNGFVASSTKDWIERLSLLIEEKDLREMLGKAGRKTVLEKYSVEANKEKFLSLFKS